jgi:uncharacterized protein (TIGR03086 family)
MDSVATMSRVIDETRRVVDGVGDDQWTLPTPCAEWTVRDLVNHLTGGSAMFAIAVEDGSIADDELARLLTTDVLGDDPKGAFRREAARAVTAFTEADDLGVVVKLPFGEMPASVALDIAVFDVTVHALDLARATGQSTDLDPEVLAAALTTGRQMIGPEMRSSGLFEAETTVPDDAPLADQLSAFAGRAI